MKNAIDLAGRRHKHRHTESIYMHIKYIHILLPSINYMYMVIMLKIVKTTVSSPYDTNNKSLYNF
jgi:hypothetical protein